MELENYYISQLLHQLSKGRSHRTALMWLRYFRGILLGFFTFPELETESVGEGPRLSDSFRFLVSICSPSSTDQSCLMHFAYMPVNSQCEEQKRLDKILPDDDLPFFFSAFIHRFMLEINRNLLSFSLMKLLGHRDILSSDIRYL